MASTEYSVCARFIGKRGSVTQNEQDLDLKLHAFCSVTCLSCPIYGAGNLRNPINRFLRQVRSQIIPIIEIREKRAKVFFVMPLASETSAFYQQLEFSNRPDRFMDEPKENGVLWSARRPGIRGRDFPGMAG
jgi:hypothetical protein